VPRPWRSLPTQGSDHLPRGGDTVTFVRGYEDEGYKRAQVDWASLARLGGTVVCYVGARS